jgi:lysophospholipase L1-like esterase
MTAQSGPSGMVDHLAASGGPTPEELAFGRAFITPGPPDPAVMATWLAPERVAGREARAAYRLANDWADLGRYRDANAGLAGCDVRTVFLGDSITEAWPLADPELFSGGTVGRGVSGQTSAQILLRLMPDAIALKPRSIHLMCGINDIAGNAGPTTPQDFMNNMTAMAGLTRIAGVELVIGSITPAAGFPWRPQLPDPRQRIHDLNLWLKALAHDHGAAYADYHAVLKTSDDDLRAELTRDGVHPLATGYQRMRPVLERVLVRDGARPA